MKLRSQSPFNLLAIDPATSCGWALHTSGMPTTCGVWDLSTRRDESNGMKLLRFRGKLREICGTFPIKAMAVERPAGRHTGAIMHQSKLIAILEAFCEEHKIEYCTYSASEIKKFATGKGNCSKEEMITAARERLSYEGNDDNEADALWLLEILKRDLSI